MQDTYLIKELNNEQSSNNQLFIKRGILLKCLDVIDISEEYYQVFLQYFYVDKNNYKRNNLYLRCLQDTYLIKDLNNEQSDNNKTPVKKGDLLHTLEIIDIGKTYYKIIHLHP